MSSGNRPRFTRNPALENAALEFFSPEFIKAHTQKELYQLVQEERRKRDQSQPQSQTQTQARSSSIHHPRGHESAGATNVRSTPPSFDAEEHTRPTIHVPAPVTALHPPVPSSEPSALTSPLRGTAAANSNNHTNSQTNSHTNSHTHTNTNANANANRNANSHSRRAAEHAHSRDDSAGNSKPPAADDMLSVVGDIEAQFASWHAGVKRCIKQVRLLESPQDHEVLNKCFSAEERTRIVQSIKSNAKEVYWNLYRLLSDIYQQRNEQLQEWGQDALLTRDDQEYCQDRQQALFDLVTRYKQLLH